MPRKKFTFGQHRIFTVTQKEHTRQGEDYKIDDLQSDDPIFYKNVPKLSLHSSRLITYRGLKLQWPGEAIYRVYGIGEHKTEWPSNEVVVSTRMQIVNAKNGAVEYTVRLKRLGLVTGFFGKQIGVWKGANDKGRPYLEMRGDFVDMNFDIFVYESMRRVTRVGTVSKDLFNMKEKLRDRGRYAVQVQPEYDSGLLVLLAIIVDEVFSKSNQNCRQYLDRNARGKGQSSKNELRTRK